MSDSDQQPLDEGKAESDPSKLFGDPHRLRSDMKMLESAFARRFPIKDEIRAAMVTKAAKLMLDHAVQHKVQLGAIRALTMMERMCQVDELHAMKSGDDPARPQPTTRTPDQTTIEMDMTIPFVPDKEAQ